MRWLARNVDQAGGATNARQEVEWSPFDLLRVVAASSLLVLLVAEALFGTALARFDAPDVTDAVLAEVWRQLVILRRHRVAHRDLRLANVFLDREGGVWLIDFGFAGLAASALLLATDLAEFVASLSVKVGAARAAASGAAALGSDALRTALPRLRPNLLSGATRTALKGSPRLLDEVQRAVAAPATAWPTLSHGR